MESFNDRGYAIKMYRCDSSDYGLPQVRLRLFFVAVKRSSPLLSWAPRRDKGFFSELGLLMKKSKREPPDVFHAALPSQHAAVVAELERRSGKAPQHRNPADENWPQLHQDFLKSQGFRWGALKLSPEMAESPWVALLSPREAEVLAYRQAIAGPAASGDVSQTISRTPTLATVGEKTLACTLLPGQGLRPDLKSYHM